MGLFHIFFDVPGTGELVLGLIVGESLFKAALPVVVGQKGKARGAAAGGIELDQLIGQIPGGLLGPHLGLGPGGPAQLAEPDVGVLRGADVFAHQVQSGGGHIEKVGACKGDLQIIPGDSVALDALHAHEAADAVVLVNHIIPRGQIAEGFDPVTVAGLFPGSAVPPPLENGPVAQDGQGDGGILHPGGQRPFQQTHMIPLRKIGGVGDIVFRQKPGHVLQSLGAASEDAHLIAQRKVGADISQSGFQTAAVRGQLFDRQRENGVGRQSAGGGEERVHGHQTQAFQPGQSLLKAEGEGAVGGDQASLFQKTCHILADPEGKTAPPFPQSGSIVQNHQGVFRQIVQGGGQAGIDQGQIPVTGREQSLLFQPFGVLFQVFPQGRRGVFVPGQLQKLLGQRFLSSFIQLGQGLPGRKDQGFFHILQPSLALRVKFPQGIHGVSEKFRTHRQSGPGGENVHNAAAHRKLAASLHRKATGIACGHQGLFQLFQGHFFVQFQGDGRLFQGFGRDAGHHQSFDGCRHHRMLSMGKGIKGLQALVFVVPGGTFHIVEHIFPPGQQGHGQAGQMGKIPGQPPGAFFISADHHHRPSGVFLQGGGKMGLVHRGDAVERNGFFPLIQGLFQPFVFRQGIETLQQFFHVFLHKAIPRSQRNGGVKNVKFCVLLILWGREARR